jgi:hypothetical protein
MYQERYEETLQRYLWYHNHALEFDQGQSVVRVSSVLSNWIELGRRYPKAKQALIEIRDRDAQKLARGEGYSDLFIDVSSINQYLGNEDATYSLFKTIKQRDPALARQCYFYVEDLLVRKGEYALCLSHMGDPEDRFETIRDSLEMDRDVLKNGADEQQRIAEEERKRGGTDAPSQKDIARWNRSGDRSADRHFVDNTLQLIEILVATGHKTEAEKIRDEAVAVLNVPKLQSAVSDAEQKLQKQHQP